MWKFGWVMLLTVSHSSDWMEPNLGVRPNAMGLRVFLLDSLTKAGGEVDHPHWIILGDYNKMGRWTWQCICVMFILCTWKQPTDILATYELETCCLLWLQMMDLAENVQMAGFLQDTRMGNAVLFSQVGFDRSVLDVPCPCRPCRAHLGVAPACKAGCRHKRAAAEKQHPKARVEPCQGLV